MMVFNFLLRLFNLIPKWLLISSVAVFVAYMLGISHGREPYKLAVKVHEVKAKLVNQAFDQTEKYIRQKGKEVNEAIEIDYCKISDADARKLSNIGNN
ncbi:MAG: hypothetical protein OCD03_02920 [Hyphomicrobiales bacterium]